MRLCKLNALSHLQLLFGHFDLVQNPASRVSRSLGRRVETGYSSRHQLNCNNFQRCQIIERAPATCRFAFFFPFLVILLFFASSALLWDPRMHFCSCLLLQRRGFWCGLSRQKGRPWLSFAVYSSDLCNMGQAQRQRGGGSTSISHSSQVP